VQELRRRVQQDPASLAFAPLAEELRRAGRLDEAVQVCRAGLRSHPEYVSARVTMGRALIESGATDEGCEALSAVLDAAPNNLAAIRGVADVLATRGDRGAALDKYRLALQFAPQDEDLRRAVRALEEPTGATPAPIPTGPLSTPSTEARRPAGTLVLLSRLEAVLAAVLADRADRAAARPS
jgi:tetratricopeptide (TPR) repeat protein